MQDNNPYCPICDGCGEEGCCSPLMCDQHPEGHYCGWYLKDLKFGYKMFQWMDKNVTLTPEQKELYNKAWDEAYDEFYLTKNENEKAPD
jgi:hypothetical protein